MKLLKFDIIHPNHYLQKKQQEWKEDLDKLSLEDYHDKLVKLRSNFSDFYTYSFSQLGWEAREFFPSDNIYLEKVAQNLFGNSLIIERVKNQLKNKLYPIEERWKYFIIREYIKNYNPDILFIREAVGISSRFWREFSNKKLVVARLSAPLPADWSPFDFDVIYTDVPIYQKLFDFNNIKHYFNYNGFDKRVLDELETTDKVYDITFVGGLGINAFKDRTQLMNEIAKSDDIKFCWWGYKTSKIQESLNNTHQGITGGLEMFQVYKNSKIVLNDYIGIAENVALNQRMYEVMGVGSLLLTRYSDDITKFFPSDILITYRNAAECLDKIHYFLKNEKEREEIAKLGQSYILEHFSYLKNMQQVKSELTKEYVDKFKG